MSASLPVHDTFVIEQSYPAEPAAVFAAFSQQDKKQRWYAVSPAHEQLAYSLDFQIDGDEELTAKMLPGTPIAGSILRWAGRYVEIVPDERIVFFQTLDVGERRVSGAVVTVEFSPGENGTKVSLTHQAVFFEGADGPDMRRMGWQFLLEAVGQTLEAA
jgi:uncharacterized protein YndB with AHSA1/START domain